jgi:hypothetical protein
MLTKGDFFMEARLISPKLCISIVIFFMVCLLGCVLDLKAKQLSPGYMQDDAVRVKLISADNDTDAMEFQIFYNYDGPSAFLFPHTTFKYLPEKAIGLAPRNLLTIKCSKGSYQPVFIQDGGLASGVAPDGYEGPFYISMWLAQPNASFANKTNICYAVKKGKIGTIGVKIGQKGDYRLVAHDDVMFIQ